MGVSTCMGETVNHSINPARLAKTEKAGWRISEWCPAVGIARSTFYTLSGERAPESVLVGSMHIVLEAPQDWLRRVGTAQSPREQATV